MSRDTKQLTSIVVAIAVSAIGAVLYGNYVINDTITKNVDQTRQTASLELVDTSDAQLIVVDSGYNSATDLLQTASGVNTYLQTDEVTITVEPTTTTQVTEDSMAKSEQNTNTTPARTTDSSTVNVDQTPASQPIQATPPPYRKQITVTTIPVEVQGE